MAYRSQLFAITTGKDWFLRQKEQVEAEIARMNRVLDMIRYKCWYYEQAIRDGSEERIASMEPEEMPEEIRRPMKIHIEEI